MLLLVRRLATLTKMASAGRDGQRRLELCFSVVSGVRSPAIYVTRPSGHVHHVPLVREWNASCARIATPSDGRYRVELMVEGAHGAEVALLFEHRVGPHPIEASMASPVSSPRRLRPGAAARELVRLINASRSDHGLPALLDAASLARVALAHSRDMRDHRFFGHRSPRRGDLARRAMPLADRFAHIAENLAISADPRRAHRRLMGSPSHRRVILSRDLTHLGVGVVADSRGLLYIAECFGRR
jgi:hypothetical protein